MSDLIELNANPVTVVYIMGYGRSGSTVSDILLNSHPDVVSAGALNNIYRWILEKQNCACGETICQCDFWSKIVSNHTGDYKDAAFAGQVEEQLAVQDNVERMSKYSSVLFDKIPPGLRTRYRKQMDDVFRQIADASGSHFVVDSSKSTRDCTGRPLALHRYSSVNVKVIHLVRDGRGVAWSAVKSGGSQERKRVTEFRPYNFFRTTFSWTLTNFLALLTRRKLDDEHYLQLRYEDLIDQPEAQLRRIGKFIALDVQPIIDKLESDEALSVGHNLGGNRVRFNRTIRFNPDQSWKNEMPYFYKLMFWLLAAPIARVFRYRWSDGF